LPVDDDALAASEWAVGVGLPQTPQHRAATRAPTLAGTAGADGRPLSRLLELRSARDFVAERVQVCQREPARGPVRARKDPAIRRHADRRAPAAGAREVWDTQDRGQNGLGRGDQTRRSGEAPNPLPEFDVAE